MQAIAEEKAELTCSGCGNQWKGKAEVLPIRTDRSNFIYRNPSPDIPDMTGERIEPGHIRSVWKLTERERDDIVQGLNIELNIFAEPIPPVSLNVTYEGATLRMMLPVIVVERFRGRRRSLVRTHGLRIRGGVWSVQGGIRASGVRGSRCAV